MNHTLDLLLRRRSVRKYSSRIPTREELETVVRAGFQAPFSYQLCSLLLKRDARKNPYHAPLLFTLCVDFFRHEAVMEKRGWKMVSNDLSMLFFGIQDVSLVAENLAIAGESLGMGSCLLGGTPYQAERIVKQYRLPPRVFPLVQLTMGYPAEDFPPRPRYPLEFSLFEDAYPEFSDNQISAAMQVMDDGYLAQGYYKKQRIKIPLQGKRPESYDFSNYSWTEHISRKAGLWLDDPNELIIQLEKCGIFLMRKKT